MTSRLDAGGCRWFLRLAASVASVVGLLPAIVCGQSGGIPLAVTTLAGQPGTRQVTNGTGAAARFYAPAGVVANSAGHVFVADTSNNLFRRVTPGGVVTTFSGTPIDSEDHPINTGSTDGPADVARFCLGLSVSDGAYAPPIFTIVGSFTMAADPAGNIYFADSLNNTVRRLAADGSVLTLAGSSHTLGSEDGGGSEARFSYPTGVARDPSGNLFVADCANHTIRKIDLGGVVSTFAGLPGMSGSADGAGSAARFCNPTGIVADAAGNVFVTDAANHLVRKITRLGEVSTIAGLPGARGAADGIGTAARFNEPSGIAIDAAGQLLVADTGNHLIRRISSTGVVSTIAGAAGIGGAADGIGPAARFLSPAGLTIDAAGNVYIADTGNHTLRLGTFDPANTVPLITQQPAGRSAALGSTTTFSVGATGTAPLQYQWQKNGTDIAGATSAFFTLTNIQSTDAGLYRVIVRNSLGSATSLAAQLVTLASGFSATQSLTGAGFIAGNSVTLTNRFAFVGSPSSLGWQMLLPAGWTLAGSAGDEGDVKPPPGSTGVLEWAWTEVPPSPVNFTVTLNVPSDHAGTKQITSLALIRESGVLTQFLVHPDPLLIPQVQPHSADTNTDLRISLVELTRVIELYNTRFGTVRTGAYLVATIATEDGFAPDPTRAVGATVTLPRYHSSDFKGSTTGAPRDARIDLVELTRVIELYNTRAGTTRTGAYHPQPGSEDGFAPGP